MSQFKPEQIDITSASFDEGVFNDFYQTYFPKIYNYVYIQIRETAWAEELTGQIFEKILRGLTLYEASKGGLNTWIYSVAKNQIIDFHKSKQRQMNQPVEADRPEQKALEPSPEEHMVLREKQKTVRGLLNQLPEREREIMMLKFYGGWDSREIAEYMGLKKEQIYMTVHRTLKKLKAIIAEQNIEF